MYLLFQAGPLVSWTSQVEARLWSLWYYYSIDGFFLEALLLLLFCALLPISMDENVYKQLRSILPLCGRGNLVLMNYLSSELVQLVVLLNLKPEYSPSDLMFLVIQKKSWFIEPIRVCHTKNHLQPSSSDFVCYIIVVMVPCPVTLEKRLFKTYSLFLWRLITIWTISFNTWNLKFIVLKKF